MDMWQPSPLPLVWNVDAARRLLWLHRSSSASTTTRRTSKMEKLEIMVRLASERNIDQVLLEFKEYATEVDVDFVRKVGDPKSGTGRGSGRQALWRFLLLALGLPGWARPGLLGHGCGQAAAHACSRLHSGGGPGACALQQACWG